MTGERILKLRVMLKGRPVRAYVFKKDVITIGRNPESDVYLDNPGVSRDHLRIVLTPHGTYAAEDLGSANGTFINDVLIRRQNILDNDVIRLGKYSLWATYEQERRGDGAERAAPPSAHEGTTVLTTSELEEVITQARDAEEGPDGPTNEFDVGKFRVKVLSRAATGWLVLIAFLSTVLGCALGAGAVLLWKR
jgi:pSer/pThr/pTyr-binding forkhead associated (FHA) protein